VFRKHGAAGSNPAISIINMQFKPGMIVITQGTPQSLASRIVHWATKSWWTHGFVVINETDAIEVLIPKVRKLNIQERLAELEREHRDYIVMDLPGITDEERQKVAEAATSFLGWDYDVWNCLYFGIKKMWLGSRRGMFCSRHWTASFFKGLGKSILDKTKLPDSLKHRCKNFDEGFCTPDEVFRYGVFEVVYRTKNNVDDTGGVF
jgi:hypothetical protein